MICFAYTVLNDRFCKNTVSMNFGIVTVSVTLVITIFEIISVTIFETLIIISVTIDNISYTLFV